jgi:spermidine synthase
MDSLAMPSATSDAEETLSHPDRSSVPVPVVSEEAGVLTLHFQSDYVQSQMLLDEPDSLALTYSRTMMAFELFKPAPPKIAMIGLGGGSMAKWCYRHHPQSELTVVEINPHVIALRDRFRIPQDDRRFRILCEDGTKFVAETSWKFDVLLVDAFGVDHLPPELCTQRFYDDCYQTLTRSGLMVVNLCDEDNHAILTRIRRSFNSQVLLSPDADGNTVVFACKGELLWSKGESPGSLQMKLRKFEKKYGLGKAMAPVS